MAHHNFDRSFTKSDYLASLISDFTRRAPTYAEGWSGEHHVDMLRNLLKIYPPIEPTLDVACGTGLLSTICPRPQYVVGVDVTRAMLYEARRAAPQSSYIEARAEMLPFRDASFGSVYICAALPYFIDPHSALREAWRVLQDGGFLAYQAVTVDSYVAGVSMRQALEEVLGVEKADRVFKTPHTITNSKADNEKLLREVGFINVQVEMMVEKVRMEVDDAEAWWVKLNRNALTKKISLLEREVLERVRKRYVQLMEEQRNVENVIMDQIRSWYVKGTKPKLR